MRQFYYFITDKQGIEFPCLVTLKMAKGEIKEFVKAEAIKSHERRDAEIKEYFAKQENIIECLNHIEYHEL